jgi:hypothetical protein
MSKYCIRNLDETILSGKESILELNVFLNKCIVLDEFDIIYW